MMFRDREHLVRLAALIGLAFVAFMFVRTLFVPKGFGTHGHYRYGAVADAAARELRYAGRGTCLECHSDMGDTLSVGAHRTVGCEACHGPLAAHANDPTGVAVVKPDSRALCAVCHAAESSHPRNFPQVDVEEHAGSAPCADCHRPHTPRIGEGRS